MSYEQTVIGFHNQLIAEKGVADATGFSREGQRKRFDVFAEYLPHDAITLLDFGCGVADFYGYLKAEEFAADYTGVEINTVIRDEANRRTNGRVRYELPEQHFDWIVASGVLCYKHDGAKAEHGELIKMLWGHCRCGLIFNVLTTLQEDPPREKHTVYSPSEIIERVTTFTPKFALRHDYLSNDMTAVMMKP